MIILRRMSIKKVMTTAFLFLFGVSFFYSQSLVELARKEKERRAKLRGEKVIVITNAELVKLKKKPAVSVTQIETPEGESLEVEMPLITPPAEAEQSPQSEDTEAEVLQGLDELESKWNKTKEYVELLTLKMNALWLEFYSLDDMAPRDNIQREISETYLKLQKAEQDEEKVRIELEQIRRKRKK